MDTHPDSIKSNDRERKTFRDPDFGWKSVWCMQCTNMPSWCISCNFMHLTTFVQVTVAEHDFEAESDILPKPGPRLYRLGKFR